MQEKNFLLEMEHITKRFPGSIALSDASIHVARGEVHALIGENGAGKSTLIKVLTGVYRSDEGTILFDGTLINSSIVSTSYRSNRIFLFRELVMTTFRLVVLFGQKLPYYHLFF